MAHQDRCVGGDAATHTLTHRTVREELSLNYVSRKWQLPNCAPADQRDSDKAGRPHMKTCPLTVSHRYL